MIVQMMNDLPEMDKEAAERNAEILARWNASTAGNWMTSADTPGSVYDSEIIAICNLDDPEVSGLHHILKVDDLDDRPADLIFAANAHQDIPYLVGFIAELTATIVLLRQRVDQLSDIVHGTEAQQ